MSKNVGQFAQNLSMYLYGAENLRQRSVTGKCSNRLKGTKPSRPAITPTKLKFIYSKYLNMKERFNTFDVVLFLVDKARERVSLEKGANNLEQITSLAEETIINRAIAEKIANLNKAFNYAALRAQERSSSTTHSVP